MVLMLLMDVDHHTTTHDNDDLNSQYEQGVLRSPLIVYF